MSSTTLKCTNSESIGILAGGIAHDFNNLLAEIVGYISLVKMSLSPDNEMYLRLTDAEQASMRARDLTHRLLAFAEGGKPRKRPVPLPEMVNEAVRTSLEHSAVACSVSADVDLCMVEADRAQIVRVLCSLLTNARESMPRGGRIGITMDNWQCAAGDRVPLKAGRYVRIRIRDEGPGIPAKNLGKVFDPYFTTKPWGTKKGLGLSLAICLSTVRAHGGLLTLHSDPAVGTTATVMLPVCRMSRLPKKSMLRRMMRDPVWKGQAA